MKRFNKKYIIGGLLLFVAGVLFVIQLNKNKKKISTLNPAAIERLELMRQNLIGKGLSKIDVIISKEEFKSEEDKIIGFYHSYDCSSCVRKLMNTITVVDSLWPEMKVYVISNSLENMSFLVNAGIHVPFFVDKKAIFQEWINFSYTSILLYLNKNEVIKEVYFSTTPVYKKSRKRFFGFLKRQ